MGVRISSGLAVLGGLQPESDLDVLVVTRWQTTREDDPRRVDRLLTIRAGRTTPFGRMEEDARACRKPNSMRSS